MSETPTAPALETQSTYRLPSRERPAELHEVYQAYTNYETEVGDPNNLNIYSDDLMDGGYVDQMVEDSRAEAKDAAKSPTQELEEALANTPESALPSYIETHGVFIVQKRREQAKYTLAA